jgi:hypothetical protein
MDDWLARGLKAMGAMGDDERATIAMRLERALENNAVVFGKHAFRKHATVDRPRSVINASLFDVMTTSLARVESSRVLARAEPLRQAFYQRMGDPVFVRAITYGTNTPKEVRTRFAIAKEMMEEVFNAD